jgi:hypothetical protein
MKKLKRIKASSTLPTYKDLVYCLEMLTFGCDVEEFKLINTILNRAKIKTS